MSRLALFPPLVFVVLSPGCLGDLAAVETGGSRVGIAPDCDASEVDCWPEADRAVLVAAERALFDAGAAPFEVRAPVVCEAAISVARLDHKLHDDERDVLAWLQSELCSGLPLDEEALEARATSLFTDVVARLDSDMTSAHLLPATEEIVELAAVSEASCTSCAAALHYGGPGYVPEHWAPGVRQALREVDANGGVLATMFVALVVTSGVYDRDFGAELAELQASGLTIEEQLDRVQTQSMRWARWVGRISGLAMAVPFVGVSISIGAREFLILEHRVTTAIRLAMVRGWDPYDPRSVLLAMAVAFNEGTLPWLVEDFTVAVAERFATGTLARLYGRFLRDRAFAAIARAGASAGATRVAGILVGVLTVGIGSGLIGGVIEGELQERYCTNVRAALDGLSVPPAPR